MAIVIETVKCAEDDNGLIIRLYESVRWRGKTYLRTSFKIKAAWETNLLEENEQELKINDDNSISLYFTPFQIRTIRVIPA